MHRQGVQLSSSAKIINGANNILAAKPSFHNSSQKPDEKLHDGTRVKSTFVFIATPSCYPILPMNDYPR